MDTDQIQQPDATMDANQIQQPDTITEMDTTPQTETNGIDKTYTLICENNEKITIKKSILIMSSTLKNLIETFPDDEEGIEIPVHRINVDIMKAVIDFCEVYRVKIMSQMTPEERQAFRDEDPDEYCKRFVIDSYESNNFVCKMVNAANFLDIPLLLDAACKGVSNCIKFMKEEDMRVTLRYEGPEPRDEDPLVKDIKDKLPWFCHTKLNKPDPNKKKKKHKYEGIDSDDSDDSTDSSSSSSSESEDSDTSDDDDDDDANAPPAIEEASN